MQAMSEHSTTTLSLGMIGLGKMGGNMTRRILRAGLPMVGTDRHEENVRPLAEEGMTVAAGTADLVNKLGEAGERAVWVMVPAGAATEAVLNELAELLAPGDIVIDGGNSNYKDTMRRAEFLAQRGIFMLDVGTSGGVWGLAEGYAMMIGGDEAATERMRAHFEALALAADRGWGRMGPSGSGHYVKMVHNGIEYGMMQAYAEGFELMKSKTEFDLDMAEIAELWRHGSVVRSWLLDLTAEALKMDPHFSGVGDVVSDSGEGRWTIIDSIEQGVPAPVITLATQMRFRSQQELSYSGQMLSVMRRAFGGHAIQTTAGQTVPDVHPAAVPEASQE